ncbi:MAG: universal stress protein UspA [Legionellales bacterium]|nr:universal stress protein UspA [Legionellales bacterium]|tara:strand:- start:78 stop:491 length:414 start_codon:yes stop_codon:yes gene_type:complete
MYKHILFATDLADEGKSTGRKARQLADTFTADLSIIHVIEPIPAYGYMGITDIASPHIDEAKEAIAKFAEEFNVTPDHTHVKIGPTKTEILAAAEGLGADLIVLGSHGTHGLSLLLGSTANAVLHGAKCDVLTVRFQ